MIVFWLLQLLCLPLTLLSYALWVVHLMRFSRRTRTSVTVLASLYPRSMMSLLGTRPDEPAVRLMRVMPHVPFYAHWLTYPTRLAHMLTGYVPHRYRYPFTREAQMSDQTVARVTFYDQALERHRNHVEQLVVLGAGFDTRCFRVSLRCFEVDAPRTHDFKLKMLREAGLDTDHATYVGADFLRESWLERLVASGFDAHKPTFFLWESVTMYLDEASVVATLHTIATLPGAVLAFDYFTQEMLDSQEASMRYLRALVRAGNEPWTFGLREPVKDFVERRGLRAEEVRAFGPQAGFCVCLGQQIR